MLSLLTPLRHRRWITGQSAARRVASSSATSAWPASSATASTSTCPPCPTCSTCSTCSTCDVALASMTRLLLLPFAGHFWPLQAFPRSSQ